MQHQKLHCREQSLLACFGRNCHLPIHILVCIKLMYTHSIRPCRPDTALCCSILLQVLPIAFLPGNACFFCRRMSSHLCPSAAVCPVVDALVQVHRSRRSSLRLCACVVHVHLRLKCKSLLSHPFCDCLGEGRCLRRWNVLIQTVCNRDGQARFGDYYCHRAVEVISRVLDSWSSGRRQSVLCLMLVALPAGGSGCGHDHRPPRSST